MAFIFLCSNVYSQHKLKIDPKLEVGFAYRVAAFELSDYPSRSTPNFTYYYNGISHFRNSNLAIAIQQYVFKEKVSLRLSSYFRYNHLFFGKNAQGISGPNEKEYKRLKYDVFIDGLYHFKKRKANSFGLILGAGIGEMNLGTNFKDSIWTGSKNELIKRNFSFIAPRLLVGISKNSLSVFAIAHGTPDTDYRSNPTIWLEFKIAYSFSPFKKRIIK